ncbi:MAG: DNA mismatch repair endonuclease MutL [Bacteroidales bacterium]
MADVIRLLPDSLANQIAAGEVVQRPASVVKELIENAIDAGATRIAVVLVDSGRTLIQVIDNGVGMSETDARMAFERHATSKISKPDDLFSITTMGFRGEALASIAAVAEVILQTRRAVDEVGVEIQIRASEVVAQEYVACPQGANFSVKNLFYNVPARRKFLKSDAYELRLSILEVQKIALAFPTIEISFTHNGNELFHYYPAGNIRQRIIQVLGKSAASSLIEIKSDTILARILGYVGKPEAAKKSQNDQYFFVNRRYMRHSLFHKAVMQAYEKVLAPGFQPSYLIFFEVDPQKIDVNIHPTKTEIKFEDEQALWQILNAAVRESLGKFNVVPSLDFETEMAIPIPVPSKNEPVKIPTININPEYNPFEKGSEKDSFPRSSEDILVKQNLPYWETLLSGFENEPRQTTAFPSEQQEDAIGVHRKFVQIKGKYIVIPSKSGFMLIDQRRAHERILFEQFLSVYKGSHQPTQRQLFPQTIALSANDYMLVESYVDVLRQAGFEIRCIEDYQIEVYGCPSFLDNSDIKQVVEQIIASLNHVPASEAVEEYIAGILSKSSAIPYGKILSDAEMEHLIDRLFACSNHRYTPDGKAIITLFTLEEIEKRFG